MPLQQPSTPQYVAIATDLRRRIVDKREWLPGERIPSHRALREEYKASDSVIHAARKILIDEGLLETHIGAGMYVRRQTVRRRVTHTPASAGVLTLPRYVAIAADLRRRIVDKREWLPGERIPSHRALREEYEAGDSVIHAVRKMLIDEGLLETHIGAGVYVRRQTVRRRVTRTDRTPAGVAVLTLRQQEEPAGRTGDWTCRSQTITADRTIATLLRIEPGERVMESAYQFRTAGETVRLTYCYEPYSVVGATAVLLPEDGPLAGQSVEARMAAIGVTVSETEDEVVARPASTQEGDLLGGGGAAVLEVTRIYRDTDGQPVHAERTVVRGDRGSMLYRL